MDLVRLIADKKPGCSRQPRLWLFEIQFSREQFTQNSWCEEAEEKNQKTEVKPAAAISISTDYWLL